VVSLPRSPVDRLLDPIEAAYAWIQREDREARREYLDETDREAATAVTDGTATRFSR